MHDLHEPQTVQDEPHFPGDLLISHALPDAYITQQIILYTNAPTLKFYVHG